MKKAHRRERKIRGRLPEKRRKTKVSVTEYGNEGANSGIREIGLE